MSNIRWTERYPDGAEIDPADKLLAARKLVESLDDEIHGRRTAKGAAKSYAIGKLHGQLKVGGAAFNRYAREAGIKTPDRGGRNYKMPDADWLKLLHHIADHGKTRRMRNRAAELLGNRH